MKKRFLLLLFSTLLVVQIAPAQTSPTSSYVLDGGFGGAAAVLDGEVFVGLSPVGWPTGDKPAGIVHVYKKDTSGSWTESQSLSASDGMLGDHFGRSVFAGRGMVIVGAPGIGAAYVFKKDADGTWVEAGKLSPTLAEGYEFGGAYARGGMRNSTIAVSGQRILVTSYNSETRTGAVHVFHLQGTGWAEKAIFDSGNEDGGDGFGWSIAANNNTFFVGATLQNGRKGAVHVFRMNTFNGTWERSDVLSPESLTAGASLGTSIALHRQHLLIGAPRQANFGGVVAYEMLRDGSFSYMDVLQETEPADGSRKTGAFGSTVVVSGDDIMIGARGSVFAASLGSSGLSMTRITAPDTRSAGSFGMAVAASGNVLSVGSPSADYEEGVSNVFERNSAGGNWEPAGLLAAEVQRLASMYGEQVDCTDGEAGIFACEDVDLVSFMSLTELTSDRGVKMTDIWGWEDPETGKEWVLQARTEGVSFVDISNPSYPVYVGQLMKTSKSPGSAWRDVKVYKDHAFIVADGAGEHGVQIFDLRQLRDVDPEDMPVTFEETAHYSGVNSTHNMVINEETGFAYAVGNRSGGETCGGQLHMINIQDPTNPTFAGCYSLAEAGGTHDSQCVVYRGADTNYSGREICFTSNGSSFIIADVTDKDSPTTLAHTSYPNQAYTHQGWLSEDHSYFYMNDELDEMTGIVDQTRTLIWDVRELGDPTLVGEFMLDSKASDHNLYIRGNLMYQSNYQAGLRILDISDPENPVEVGHFDTTPGGEDKAGFGGSWSNYPYFKSGIIAVSSRGEGLFLLKKRSVDI
ncbi:MAG: choice-of-anchor B family protein [Bacteroidetes bacterium]|nr:MAG: choice-of-anchor B family protein [Bacteroidota bacterium]